MGIGNAFSRASGVGRRIALQQAVAPSGAFTPNGAPTGFGQPLSGKDQPEDLGAVYHTQQTPNPPSATPRQPSQNTGFAGGSISGQPAPPQSTMPNFGANNPVTREALEGYYASRGAQARGPQGGNPGSIDYWLNKQNELVNRGRELGYGNDGWDYYNKFLSNAEEFTGSPEATAMAMWGTTGQPQVEPRARLNQALSSSITQPVTRADAGDNSLLQSLLAQLQLRTQ